MQRIIVVLAGWLILALPATGFAQGVQTGTLRGAIQDAQGGAVPGVTVTVTSPAMQGPRSTVSESDGGYVFRSLPAGPYDVVFELSGFETVNKKTIVPLGQEVAQNATLQVAGVKEVVQVVAETPAPILTPVGGQNLKHDDIDVLSTGRDLFSIATLAPGLTTNTADTGQVTINGAFGFDNVFMVNGVDVNDNLFGSPQDLFIEDAIEETQVLTRGITAEYGRFTGGVINAITKSGGNKFSGSFRVGFQNERWTSQTPFETCDAAVTTPGCQAASPRPDDLQEIYEGTLGGPIVKDRLWFFASGRRRKTSDSSTLERTNAANTEIDTNNRGEIKVTGTVKANHTIQAGYLDNPSEQLNRVSLPGYTIDPHGDISPNFPNWYTYANYHGVFGSKLLGEAQYSARKFKFVDFGGTAKDLVDSPIFGLNEVLHYNAPYFDATDPEERNNFQVTGNVTYFLDTGKRGRHEIKGGYEFYRSQDTGGNSQSSTNYVYDSDFALDAAGNPAYDANGRMIPIFTQLGNGSYIENWIATRGAVLNVDNNSLFVQDHWAINGHWSADLGVRYERVRSEATGGIVGVDTDTIVPRLAVAYDIAGNGRHIIHATYGHYSGRYNEAQIGVNSNVGNPDRTFGFYVGPEGQGRDFAPGFDPANYVTYQGVFPTANVFFEPGLSSPIVKEFTTSYGTSFRKGYTEAAYIWRNTDNLIEDFITLANGTTDVVKNGVDYGTFTNRVYRNTNIADRRYQALEFQGRYNLMDRWTLNGSYTLQLTNDGNYQGENSGQPGAPSVIGDYPEIYSEARNYPDGHLVGFQRHKFILWSVYNVGLHRFGDASISGLWRVNSGTTYSLAANNVPLSDIQKALGAGYPDLPTTQTLYFADRGSEFFNGYGLLDFDVSYNVPVFRTLRPYVKFDIYNLFNNQKLISWNTTVEPDPNSPVDSLGLPTGYIKGPQFGKATSNSDFPIPFLGFSNTGGRTFRLALGFRF